MDTTATMHIINFIKGIGIKVDYETIEKETFVPGISIKDGGIIVDPTKLKYPGDILHEAGHIAVTPKNKRKDLNDNVDAFAKQGGNEMAAIAWSYAACRHLGIDSSVVFHADGYKGDSETLIDNFDNERYLGVPMLQWYGMTVDRIKAAELQVEPYPHMINWLSQQQVLNDPLTEKDKMISGEPYRANDAELIQMRADVRKKLGVYNQIGVHETGVQYGLLKQMLGECGENSWIEPPFYCDYGFNIVIGKDSYMNFDCVILDVALVTIGDNVMCGPKVQLLAATHVLDPQERNFSGTELGKPITIGNRVWLGAGVIVCPGVTIGDEAVIGAGSVVTRDIPPRVFAAGNPCRVIKDIE
jgi:maltose O-acetyltransferase